MNPLDQNISVVIEKTNTGFSAFALDHPIYTTGRSIPELMENILEAASLYFEDQGIEVDSSNIVYEIDFEQFFGFYQVLNTEFLAKRIQMDPVQLSNIVQGKKKPTASQSRSILMGIHEIGKELSDMGLLISS